MYLCIMHPNNSNYILHKVPNMSSVIKKIMDKRIESM